MGMQESMSCIDRILRPRRYGNAPAAADKGLYPAHRLIQTGAATFVRLRRANRTFKFVHGHYPSRCAADFRAFKDWNGEQGSGLGNVIADKKAFARFGQKGHFAQPPDHMLASVGQFGYAADF